MADSIFEYTGGGVTIGDAISGGSANQILFGDASTNVDQSSDLFFDSVLKIFRAGDVSSTANDTVLTVDDDSQTIQGDVVNPGIGASTIVLGTTNSTLRYNTVAGSTSQGVQANSSDARMFWVSSDHETGNKSTTSGVQMYYDDDPNTTNVYRAILGNATYILQTEYNGVTKKRFSNTMNSAFLGKRGDIDAKYNSTLITVDDSAKKIKQAADVSVSIETTAGVQRVITPMTPKSLTDNTLTSVFEISLPAGGMTGGFFTANVIADDGTDFQAHSDHVTYAAVNKAGSYTTTIQASNGDDAIAVSAGTLAISWSMTTGTDKVIVQVTANSSLTTPTIKLYLNIDNNNGHVLTLL